MVIIGRFLKNLQNLGVEYYDLACFVVSETAKYSSARSAGQAISTNINTIVSPTETFGITGGNWKLDEATIQYNGKHWYATMVFTHSGDSLGWDSDLYD